MPWSLGDISWKCLIVLTPCLGRVMLCYWAHTDVCQAPFLSALEILTHFPFTVISIPILQMRVLRHRSVKQLA